jgi:C4-dicarboxylate transporter DctM subunit
MSQTHCALVLPAAQGPGFVTANAPIVKHGMTDERILQKIAEALLAAGLGRMMVLVMVNVILPIGEQFMEPSGSS